MYTQLDSNKVSRADLKQPHILLKAFEHLHCGSLDCRLPNGDRKVFQSSNSGIHADIVIYDWRVLDRLIASGDIGFGEDYVAGYWDTENLPSLLLLFLQNREVLESYIVDQNFYHRLTHYLQAKHRSNTLSGSRDNIHAHYDLGNEFYALWLDDTFTYSCALFEGDSDRSLEAAQKAKYQRILKKLEITDNDHVLEIGCGWGGFAEQAVKQGLRITGLTISEEQYDFCNHRLGSTDLTKVDIRLQDYRELTEQFDHIVSIGMFEHVGEEFWSTYMDNVYASLQSGGKAMIQTITIHDDFFDNYQKGSDFIREHIFLGGMLPSTQRFLQEAENAGFNVQDVFHFGQDYALTLRNWTDRFEEALDQVKQLGYCDHFIRKWRFYLNSCEAAFLVGRTNVMQVLLTKN